MDVYLALFGPDECYSLVHLIVSAGRIPAVTVQKDHYLMVCSSNTNDCCRSLDQIVLWMRFSDFPGDKTACALNQAK